MPRRMIQRAFLSWFAQNRSRFAVEIKLGRRTDTSLKFTFAGINSALSGGLTTYEIEAYVYYQDDFWDIILSLDSYPKRVPGGYICSECPPESRAVFLDRPGLWKDHLFEPFLAWVNEDLAKAKWLALDGGRESGWTGARLLDKDPDPGEKRNRSLLHLLPIREPPAS